MRGAVYYLGRALQLLSLLVLPSALWVTEMTRQEAMAIGLFVSSVLIFFAGYALTRGSLKL